MEQALKIAKGWLEEENYSAIDFYKSAFYIYQLKISELYELIKEKEPKIKTKIIVNDNNYDYDYVFKEAIEKGIEEIYEMLREVKAIKSKNIDMLLELAFKSNNEKFVIKIYKNRKKEIENIYKVIKKSIDKNWFDFFMIIYSDYLNEIIGNEAQYRYFLEYLIKKTSLRWVEAVIEKSKKEIKENIDVIIISAIETKKLDILEYIVNEYELKNLNEEDKIEILEEALKEQDELFFSMVYEIIGCLNKDNAESKIFLKQLKEKKPSIYEEIVI